MGFGVGFEIGHVEDHILHTGQAKLVRGRVRGGDRVRVRVRGRGRGRGTAVGLRVRPKPSPNPNTLPEP